MKPVISDKCNLDIGSIVWYKQRKCRVVVQQNNLYMIKDRRGNIYWIKPENVMVLNEGIQDQRNRVETC